MKKNSPFLLSPSGKSYLWGGSRLNDEFEKKIKLNPLAETWECSTHTDGPSYAATGKDKGKTLKEIIESHPEYLGTRLKVKGEMPILVKFIDANKDLSVQVHPTDEYAWANENRQHGKSEMWYVLDAEKDAELVYGLSSSHDKESIRVAVEQGCLEKYLQRIPVVKGDVFFVEAGTIHAIGAGILLAEIQENSNLTYRLYDYGRTDKNGKKRPLHIDKALDTAILQRISKPRQPLRVLKYCQGAASEILGRCKSFEVYRMLINTERRQIVKYRADPMSFRVLLCINGCGTFWYSEKSTFFYKGDCLFVPADSETIQIHGQAQFLDIRG